MSYNPHLYAAVKAIRAGHPIPAVSAAILESQGWDLGALTERHLNN